MTELTPSSRASTFPSHQADSTLKGPLPPSWLHNCWCLEISWESHPYCLRKPAAQQFSLQPGPLLCVSREGRENRETCFVVRQIWVQILTPTLTRCILWASYTIFLIFEINISVPQFRQALLSLCITLTHLPWAPLCSTLPSGENRPNARQLVPLTSFCLLPRAPRRGLILVPQGLCWCRCRTLV